MKQSLSSLKKIILLQLLIGICVVLSVHADTLTLKILAINDFHGQTASGKKMSNKNVGSAPVLASYLKAAAKTVDNRVIYVESGDLIGASCPESGLLQDEPAVSFMNLFANDSSTYENHGAVEAGNVIGVPGNHEFDEGVTELKRLFGGGNYSKGPYLENPWKGARFPLISSNIWDSTQNKLLFPAYVIRKIGNARIGFIGATLQSTPSIVTGSGAAHLAFLDEATSINSAADSLKTKGVHAIVVLLHDGGNQKSYQGPTTESAAAAPEIVSLVQKMDSDIDIVVSAHSHTFTNAYVTRNDGSKMLVTQSYSAGAGYVDIDLSYSMECNDIVEKRASIIRTWVDSIPTPLDPASKAILDSALVKVGPIINEEIGSCSKPITSLQRASGESPLGDLIADAQRAATHTDFSFMNPGGIRANLDSGAISWGELYAVQPFNNLLVTMKLTGQQIYDVLNQQWADTTNVRMLQISGFTYTWNKNNPINNRVVEVRLNGIPIHKDYSYSVTTNNFLANGGDNFSVFKCGTGQVNLAVDLDVLVNYIKTRNKPFSIACDNRIQLTTITAVNHDVGNCSKTGISIRYSRIHDNLVLSFSGLPSKAEVNGSILNSRGQVVRTLKAFTDSTGKLVSTSASFPRGYYVLRVNCAGVGVTMVKRCLVW